jgi:DNA (cytosine-5)-methyltransferase 1
VNPTVISTFAGCGGSSLGYKLAGYRELLAVEWDDNAVETFRMNFPDVPVFHGDIAKLTGEECMRMAGIRPGELDVFDGSPPCQGFSTAGKRKFDDPRNSLFKEYARLLKELQPKVFVMENVTGMVKGVMKQAYLQIIKTLRECGYKSNGEVLNAMYYNVPQSRERVIIIGVRNDIGIEPSHPKPQTEPIIFRNAMRNVSQDKEQRILPDILLCYAKLHGKGWSTKPMIYKSIKGNLAGSFSLKWCEWDNVCGTLPKSEISLTGVVHPDKKRYLSASELKRIGTFPDNFVFTSRSKAVERIGNSVPPNLMKAIAEHIKINILDRWEKFTGNKAVKLA